MELLQRILATQTFYLVLDKYEYSHTRKHVHKNWDYYCSIITPANVLGQLMEHV